MILSILNPLYSFFGISSGSCDDCHNKDPDFRLFVDSFYYLTRFVYFSDATTQSIWISKLAAFIAHIRDIEWGKGLRKESYALLHIFHEFFPHESFVLFSRFLNVYGSWRDVKGICRFFVHCLHLYQHPLLDFALSLFVRELKRPSPHPLCIKWAFKNKKKDAWIYRKLLSIVPDYSFLYLKAKSNANANTSHSRSLSHDVEFGFYSHFIIDHFMHSTLSNTQLRWFHHHWSLAMQMHMESGNFVKHLSTLDSRVILPIVEFHDSMDSSCVFHTIGLVVALVALYDIQYLLVVTHVPMWISCESLSSVDLILTLWNIAQTRTFANWTASHHVVQNALSHSSDSPFFILVCSDSLPPSFVHVDLAWSVRGFRSFPPHPLPIDFQLEEKEEKEEGHLHSPPQVKFVQSGVQFGLLGALELMWRVNSQEELIATNLSCSRYVFDFQKN